MSPQGCQVIPPLSFVISLVTFGRQKEWASCHNIYDPTIWLKEFGFNCVGARPYDLRTKRKKEVKYRLRPILNNAHSSPHKSASDSKPFRKAWEHRRLWCQVRYNLPSVLKPCKGNVGWITRGLHCTEVSTCSSGCLHNYNGLWPNYPFSSPRQK